MVDIFSHAFLSTLKNGQYIVSPYGTRFSSCRYNGVYYDTIITYDLNVFDCSAFNLVRSVDNIMIYEKKKEVYQ